MADIRAEKIAPSTWEFLKKEYSLSLQQQKALIRCEHNLSEEEVRSGVQVARAHMIPVSALALIPSKNGFRPHVTSEGVMWKVHNDPRGLDKIEPDVIQWAEEDNNYCAKVKCTITLGGKDFVDFSQNSKGSDNESSLGGEQVTRECIDQAIKRACKVAVGLSLPVYEERAQETC